MVGQPNVNEELAVEDIWWCKFYPGDDETYEKHGYKPEWIGYAPTAPLAICRAALKVVTK